MKVLALALALYAVTGVTAEPEIRVVRLGSVVTATQIADLVSQATRLLSSCSVDSTSYAVTPSSWDVAFGARSSVHIRFATPQQLELDHKPIKVDEILIPLPEGTWPAHLFVRSGGVTYAFTKYRPEPLKGLVWDPPLALADEPPYSQLSSSTDE